MATGKEEPWYKQVINKAYRTIVNDVDPPSLLDAFRQEGFLPQHIRDLTECSNTSETNRKIATLVSGSGLKGYQKFKKCLKLSAQEHIIARLEQFEKKIKQKKKSGGPSFNIAGMEIRGFKHTRGEWVPKKGQIGTTAITPDGPVEVIVKGSKKGTKIRAGSIMKECGGLARECIRKGNTLKVRVTNDVPENTKKGYVIRCTYMFRGPATPDLINLAKESEKWVKDSNKKEGTKYRFSFIKSK